MYKGLWFHVRWVNHFDNHSWANTLAENIFLDTLLFLANLIEKGARLSYPTNKGVDGKPLFETIERWRGLF